MQKNNYYVYEHIRLDNNTCFYVGKGKGRRVRRFKRNPHHDNIATKYGYTVEIIADNLTEEEALELEKDRIKRYVLELGYNIDIKGYTKKNSKKCLTNRTWGGDGSNGHNVSEDLKRILSNKSKNQWRNMSDEALKKYSERMRQIYYDKTPEERKALYKNRNYTKGENNPMSRKIVGYSLNYEEKFNCIEDAVKKYNLQSAGIRQCCYDKINHSGFKDNKFPFVWNYIEDYKLMTNDQKKLRIKSAMKNITIYCITTKEIFKNAPYAKEKYNLSSYTHISECCKGKSLYAGVYNNQKLQWCYYLDFLEQNKLI